jgi:EAL domain-containing protein (putative c-di-GMP-specific phosphodiesterase class I)/PAS domain-containing protein
MTGEDVDGRPSTAATIQRLRLDRDRYVAFAFAAADLLLEVDAGGAVTSAAGAAHSLLGVNLEQLKGRTVTDFVIVRDRPLVRQLLRQVQTRYRIDSTPIGLARQDGIATRILFGGCRLPDRGGDHAFLGLRLIPDTFAPVPCHRDMETGLLTPDGLRDVAQRLAHAEDGVARSLQLVRLDGLSGIARELPADRAALLMQEIGASLRANSVGGDAAGRLSDDSFGTVTKAGSGPGSDPDLATELAEAIRDAGIPCDRIAPRVVRIDLELGGLSDADAARALTYAMSSFARSQSAGFNIQTLQAGLAGAVHATVSRFAEIRTMLTDRRFALVYQPVVDLSSRTVHHYEALSRFPAEADVADTVMFSEDVGLVTELDLAVCRLALDALAAGGDARVAVNLSARSVQTAAFRNALGTLLAQLGGGRDRLLFELTESAGIDDTAEAATFLAWLKSMGHAICLDDFGAGAAAYGYLRRFDVDFVKIDGPFLQAAARRGREQALLRSVCVLCQDLGCKVIGEMIETEDVAAAAMSVGVSYGQGWLFGKPVPLLPGPVRPARRKGFVPTWE